MLRYYNADKLKNEFKMLKHENDDVCERVYEI
jgi:hypothetical protein